MSAGIYGCKLQTLQTLVCSQTLKKRRAVASRMAYWPGRTRGTWGVCAVVTAVQNIAEILRQTGVFCCRPERMQKGQTRQNTDNHGKHYPTLLRNLEGFGTPVSLSWVATSSRAFCQRRHAVLRSQAKRIVMSRQP